MKTKTFILIVLFFPLLFTLNCTEENLEPCEKNNTGNLTIINGEFSNYSLWPTMTLEVSWTDGTSKKYVIAYIKNFDDVPAGISTYIATWEDDNYWYHRVGSFEVKQCMDNEVTLFLDKKSAVTEAYSLRK